MRFSHAPALLAEYPALAVAMLRVDDVHPDSDTTTVSAPFLERARARLDGATESELPEIRAWRRAFSSMGLKPTQYRCASEALLRRLRLHGDLPTVHPVVDVCNAVSVAYAIPIAVVDVDRVDGDLQVRHADGTERYLTFGGDVEHPEPGEVTYADDGGNAHCRRWTNRQSGLSAMRPGTRRALVVAEALHDGAVGDVADLCAELAAALRTQAQVGEQSVSG